MSVHIVHPKGSMTRPPLPHFLRVSCSGCGIEAQRIEEMEKMLKEAQQEKARLIENRVSDGTSFYSGHLFNVHKFILQLVCQSDSDTLQREIICFLTTPLILVYKLIHLLMCARAMYS